MPKPPPIDPAEGTVPEGVDAAAIRRIQAKNYQTSLKVWFSREFGYCSVLDPHTGEVHEVELAKAPRWFMWRCFDEKGRRKRHELPRSGTVLLQDRLAW